MNTNQFFYVENGKQVGPVTMEELAGKITPDTDVWCDGMSDWTKAGTVPELAAVLNGSAQTTMSDAAFAAQYGSANDYIGNSQNYGNSQQQPNFGNVQQTNNYSNRKNTPTGEKPNNYLVWAIVVTVFGICMCLPLVPGIISIVFATKVDQEWSSGNVEAAKQASEKAKLFVIITAALIGVIFVFNLISGFASTFLQNMQY